MPEPLYAELPMKVLKPDPKITSLKMPFFFPHLMVAHLYGHDRQQFDELMFGGTPDNLETFWSEVEARADPRLIDHPMARREGWKRKSVPISLHGDDIPVAASANRARRVLAIAAGSNV